MKKNRYYLLLVILCIKTSSCADWLSEDGAPKLTYNYYTTEEGVEASVIAAYSYLRWGCGDERFDVLTEMGTDLFTAGSDGNFKAAFNSYGTQLNPDNSIVNGIWNNHYEGIGAANTAMNAILNSSISNEKKKLRYAEMLFIRAFLYFDLVQQFGSIPLVTEASNEVRTSFKREPIEGVYRQIITDLRQAVDGLPSQIDDSEKGRATSFAAAHLLAKVYLTRGSAVSDSRGQMPSDMDSTLYYAKEVIENGPYELMENFADLWDINNMGNPEVIFAVQFTNNPIFNANGNTFHLYWLAVYDTEPGMQRDIYYGRPFKRYRPTEKTLFGLFDRKNDSRFYKSFRWAYLSNNDKTIPIWETLEDNGSVYFIPDPAKGQVEGAAKFAFGDTAIYYTIEKTGLDLYSLEMKKLRAERIYKYYPFETHDLQHFPTLIKHLAPNRPSVAEKASSREWVRMRLAETYLIAAEAEGRMGNFQQAASYLNAIRHRAAWKEGETKAAQFWEIEGGEQNTSTTYKEIEITASQLEAANFVEFMLDERGRELLGEICRWEDLVRTEKFLDWVRQFNADAATSVKAYHKLRPIPQTHIDRLNPAGVISEEQNEGYY